LRDFYYKVIPSQIRSLLSGKSRAPVFRQAMNQFLSNPSACTHPGNALLTDLIYGWGNEAWSAREEYLAACISHALKTKGPILECGSGLSTLLIAAIAERQGQPHWVLEHQPTWANKVQGYLNEYQLNSVIVTNPLKDYGDFCWYGAPLDLMPDGFSLIVCDGPPKRTKGGRYGLVPVMKGRLKPGCHILLDDAYRCEELETAKAWAGVLDASYIVFGTVKPYIIMSLN
jgi:Methyltransferase domain